MNENMDEKAIKILEHYKIIIENENFDEYDILGFLIFIRNYLDKNLKCIGEFTDLIAHRNRDRGIVMNNIKNTIKNNYAYNEETNKVIDYKGIGEKEWRDEWYKVGEKFNIKFDEKIIKEITLCIYSLAQKTKYKDKNGNVGYIEFDAQSKYNNIALTTTEGKDNSLHICFAIYKGYEVNEKYDGAPINSVVYTIRNNGKLQLRTEHDLITEI